MKLNETIPQKPEFNLNGKTYKLNLLTLDDISYFEEKYGSIENLINIISAEGKYKEKCEIIFSQLEDKKDFLAKEIEEINRDGEEIKRTMKGPECFLKSILLKDIYEPLNAFLKAIELSSPQNNDKKKQVKAKK